MSSIEKEWRAYRAELRRRLIAARQELSADTVRQASSAIEQKLEALLLPLTASSVAFCWPFRHEVDIRPLAKRLLAHGWQTALPVVVAEQAPLGFREWSPTSKLVTDRYGICHPEQGKMLEPDIILLPVVGFDAAGFRLGYGGGYFDRTLEVLTSTIAIGVGYDVAQIDSIFPMQHDKPMNMMVTETSVFLRQAVEGKNSEFVKVSIDDGISFVRTKLRPLAGKPE